MRRLRRELEEMESAEERKNNGLCFISTAICGALGKPDDCEELSVLRQLRDTYMQETPDRRAEVALYYQLAPRIVERIDSSRSAAELWAEIARDHVLPVVAAARAGNCVAAHRLYARMVRELSLRWLVPYEQELLRVDRKE